MLGITIESTEFATEYNTETGLVRKIETVRIGAISETSAMTGKLKVADVLLSVTVDGVTQEITRRHQPIDALLNARPGSKVVFKILRAGVEMTVEQEITADMLVEYK
jgi:C-terminal processing protease CtpA/Prc